MTVDVIESLEALEKLKPEWSELYRRCPRATPFQSPEWLIPWVRHVFGGGEIWALAMRESGELIGFAPLFRWGIQQFRVSFLGAGISDYGDLLFAPDLEPQCASAVWEFLEQRRDGWDEIDIQELRTGSELLNGKPREACSVCPILELNSYPRGMDHKHQIDVRRAQNKLRKHSARFSIASEGDLSRHLEEFFRLHEARWSPMKDSIVKFHREAAAAFQATGSLRLCLLEVDQIPVATIYAFTGTRTLYCYLSGFDPAMAKSSPGAVLLAWLIDQAIAEGIEDIDFLRKPEAYKYLWGARDRVNYKVCFGATAHAVAELETATR